MSYLISLANELRLLDLSNQQVIRDFIFHLEGHRTFINAELERGLGRAALLRERNFPEKEIQNYIRKCRDQARYSRQLLTGIINILEGILRSQDNGYQRNLIRGLSGNR